LPFFTVIPVYPDAHPTAYYRSVKSSRSSQLAASLTTPLKSRSVTGGNMLYYALVFLVVALIAGFLGFGGVAFAAAGIAKILFFVFLLIFLVTLISHLMRGGAARS
jgi:uncharacterized membrane protein YtjA (UPF0391 family)